LSILDDSIGSAFSTSSSRAEAERVYEVVVLVAAADGRVGGTADNRKEKPIRKTLIVCNNGGSNPGIGARAFWQFSRGIIRARALGRGLEFLRNADTGH
jgi:hypothetical protein